MSWQKKVATVRCASVYNEFFPVKSKYIFDSIFQVIHCFDIHKKLNMKRSLLRKTDEREMFLHFLHVLYYIFSFVHIIYFLFWKGLRECKETPKYPPKSSFHFYHCNRTMAKWPLFPNLPCSWMWLYWNKRKYIKLLVQKIWEGEKWLNERRKGVNTKQKIALKKKRLWKLTLQNTSMKYFNF